MKKIESSVIMSTYNHEKSLTQAINSILSQKYEDFEFLILNDNSKDGTKEVLEKFKKKDSRIKVFNNPVNFGNYTIKKKERSVVYAGRISTEKGVEELINSWLSSNLLHYTLYIIGEGELKSVLEKKYNDKNI